MSHPSETGTGKNWARETQSHIFVEANAGSGKTTILTRRLLSLLLEGVAPSRLLALTFTRAAAGEMQIRLQDELARWCLLEDAALEKTLDEIDGQDLSGTSGLDPKRRAERLAKARRLFSRVLDAPGGVQISTFHAFCESLLKRFPLEANVPPDFTILEPADADKLLKEACKDVIERAFVQQDLGNTGGQEKIKEALDQVSLYLSEKSLIGLTRKIMGHPMESEGVNRGPGQVEAERLKSGLRKSLDLDSGLQTVPTWQDAEADFIQQVLPENTEKALMSLAKAMQDYGADGAQKFGTTIEAFWRSPLDGRQQLLSAYQNVFVTGNATPRQRILNKDIRNACPSADAIFLEEAERLLAFQHYLHRLWAYHMTAALIDLVPGIFEAYGQKKLARAALDYNDLIALAAQLMDADRAAFVHFKLDKGIDHILVDEAQDTNPAQWRLVNALSAPFFAEGGRIEGPRTLFVVGDPKQSIYGFQGVNAALFGQNRDKTAELAREAGQPFQDKPLIRSYRSLPAILKLVDHLFADQQQALYPSGLKSSLENSASALVRPDPVRHEPVRTDGPGLVEIWPPLLAPTSSQGESEEAGQQTPSRLADLCDRVAVYIEDWLDKAWIVNQHKEAAARRPHAGDVMILLRRRSHFVPALTRALQARGIPVAGADRVRLEDELAIADVLAILDWVIMPEDDLTLAAILKGPFVGMDEETLFNLAHPRKGSLWEALSASQFSSVISWLGHWLGKADYMLPYDLMQSILDSPVPLNQDETSLSGRPSGRQALIHRLGPAIADPLDELLVQALSYEENHAPSLQGFLSWFREGESEIKREITRGQAVRILTVHAAKGLEAPLVILPDTVPEKSPNELHLDWISDDQARLNIPLWTARKNRASPLGATLEAERTARNTAEQMRLLYVAMTRATDCLLICGHARLKREDEKKKKSLREFFTRDTGGWLGLAYEKIAGLEGAISSAFEDPDTLALLPDGSDYQCYCLGAHTPAPLEAQKHPESSLETISEAIPQNESINWSLATRWLREDPPVEPPPARPLSPSYAGKIDQQEAIAPIQHIPRTARSDPFKRGQAIHQLLQYLPDLPDDIRESRAVRFMEKHFPQIDAQTTIAECLRLIHDPALAFLFGPNSWPEVRVGGTIETKTGPRLVIGQIDRLAIGDDILIADFKSLRDPPQDEASIPKDYIEQMRLYRDLMQATYPEKSVKTLLVWTQTPSVSWLDFS